MKPHEAREPVASRVRLPETISNRCRILEISAVMLTALGKVVFMDILNWKLPFIIVTIAGWLIYVAVRNRTVKGILSYWGFRMDNFATVIRTILPFALASLCVFLSVGYFLDTIRLSWHIIPILVLYPAWGIIQQFLVVGLVAGNLQDLKGMTLKRETIILSTALLFGLIHYPYYWLMGGTFVLALLYGYIYLRERNLYAMGIFHGWLGAFFFYSVVGRDPFMEIFGSYLG